MIGRGDRRVHLDEMGSLKRESSFLFPLIVDSSSPLVFSGLVITSKPSVDPITFC